MPAAVLAPYKSVSKAMSPSAALPKAWPEGTAYLAEPKYSVNIDSQLLRAEKASSRASALSIVASKVQAPCSLARIKPISNPYHPANGQHGLFATQNLVPDTFILTYLGYVHDSLETDPTSDYDLGLDAELGIAVDASSMGNEARFINDYRGVSTSGPNAEFRDVLVDIGRGVLEKRIGVFVLSAGRSKSGKRAKGIAKGEEILVSYGKGFWKERKEEQERESFEFEH